MEITTKFKQVWQTQTQCWKASQFRQSTTKCYQKKIIQALKEALYRKRIRTWTHREWNGTSKGKTAATIRNN